MMDPKKICMPSMIETMQTVGIIAVHILFFLLHA